MDWKDFLKKRALPVFGAFVVIVVVGYIAVRFIDWSSVSESSDAVLPQAVFCSTNTNLLGDTMTVSLTRRPTILENWVDARSELVADARIEAEDEAKDSFEDYLDDIDCPEECPNLTQAGAISYVTTNTAITGAEGFGYIRYDVSASSQASGVFICN